MFATIKRYFLRLAGPGLLAVFLTLLGAANAHAASVHVTGTVTDQNGAGVQNVNITATDPGGSTVLFGPTFSGATGSYQLDVDPGTYDFHFVPPSGSGLNSAVVSNFTVFTDQVLNVSFTPITHTLSGTLTDKNGVPIRLAFVGLTPAGSGAADNTHTDDTGHYSIAAVLVSTPSTSTSIPPKIPPELSSPTMSAMP